MSMPIARIRFQLRQLGERSFDRRFGVRTRGVMEMPDFAGFGDDLRRDAGAYYPSHNRLVRRLIRKSGVRPASFTFVDLGCGRGRPLLVASGFGFAAVVGVEADGVLAAIAEQNARRYALRRPGSPITIVGADARTFAFPEGNLFIYLYNPFSGEVFKAVADRLAELADDPGRLVVIAYATPMQADVLEATGKFQRKPLRPRQFWKLPTVLYFYNRRAAAEALAAEPERSTGDLRVRRRPI